MEVMRKYPAGMQSFEKIRREGYVYIDKTPLVYKMISEGGAYFLSRPRRFGKSLLISTLSAVFEGKRDLFEAFTTEDGVEQPSLYITTTGWRWERYPVLRFDFSAGDLHTIEQLDELINVTLSSYEQQYNVVPVSKSANIRMINLLRTLHEKTGKRVVVLVDEYDNFILHAMGDKEKTEMARQRFQNLFAPLKAEDEHLQFVFITGISKFSQMGIFSKLNSLTNISMVPMYETLCGITEEELVSNMQPDIRCLAEANRLSYDEQLAELKSMYDGYHFSEGMTDIYNPFSLVSVFKTQQVASYWFDRGTSGALIDMLRKLPSFDITQIESNVYPDTMFDLPFESYDNPLPLLYQSGYLTIKAIEREYGQYLYTLGMPNNEVRYGFADCLYRYVAGDEGEPSRSMFFQAYVKFRRNNDLTTFIEAMKVFYAGLPYSWETDNRNEHYYHALLYTLLVSFGADVIAEEPTARGNTDMTLRMPNAIYVIELKYDRTADEAIAQINEKGYADKYQLDGRPVIRVGIVFSSKKRNIIDWRAE